MDKITFNAESIKIDSLKKELVLEVWPKKLWN